MGRESLQTPVPIILSRFSPSDFLQSFKSCNITFALSNYQKFELGRHVVNVSINREKSCRKRHNTLLLPHLRFVINLKESVMEPVKTIQYLCIVIDLMQMTLSLTEKVKKIWQECKIIFSMKEITVLQLTQLVDLLSFITKVLLQAQIQFFYLQFQQVSAPKAGICIQRENYY